MAQLGLSIKTGKAACTTEVLFVFKVICSCCGGKDFVLGDSPCMQRICSLNALVIRKDSNTRSP